MKEAGFYIMSEFYRLLNGVISVPVYNTQIDANSTVKQYVIITPSFNESGSTKNSFHGDYYINIDIQDIVPDNAQSWEAVNGIANEVLDIICPNPSLKALSNSADFAVLACRKLRGRDMPILRTDTEMIMRKVIEFEIKISQK